MIFNFLKEDPQAQVMPKDVDKITDMLHEREMGNQDMMTEFVKMDLVEGCMICQDSPIPIKMYRSAFNQWLQKVKIPQSYAYDLAFEHLKYNIDVRNKQKNKPAMLRLKKKSDVAKVGNGDDYDVCRAVLSKKYQPLQNTTAFSQFKEILSWSSMDITSCLLGEKIFMVVTKGHDILDDETVTGFELVNGETGHCSLAINTSIHLGDTYVLISDKDSAKQFSYKSTHLNRNIKSEMIVHAKKIVENFDSFKQYLEDSKKHQVSTKNLLDCRDRLDQALGRKESREVIETLHLKTRHTAAKMIAEIGDDLTDVEKQRVMKFAAGKLLIG